MDALPRSAAVVPPSAWWLVLCLVGLDYFSTLAYLPSIAVEAAGPLAPIAAVVVVVTTLLGAVPVYTYVVGRSPHGNGAIGLLEHSLHGWRSKFLILALMGFVATDFIITRSLSLADAAHHVLENSHWHRLMDRLAPNPESVQDWFGPTLWKTVQHYWTRQMGLTIGLSLLACGFLMWLERGITRNVLWLAAVVVSVYLLLSGVVIASGLKYLLLHSETREAWWGRVIECGHRAGAHSPFDWRLSFLILGAFPQLALGISGFELSMTLAPLVQGNPDDDPAIPRGRIWNTRKMIIVAALIMACYLLGAVFCTTLLIPRDALVGDGPARHRALAYLAHGGLLADGGSAVTLNPLFGGWFGSLYDASTVGILCLAGASVMIGLRDLVPDYLHRLGMELNWAHRFGFAMHMLNSVGLLVTVVFKASVSAQQWAYATSVLVLLAGASFAAAQDLNCRWRGNPYRWLVTAPGRLACGFFLGMSCLTMFINRSGLVIAGLFVTAIIITSIGSRWYRSMELRFEGFDFETSRSEDRWREICRLDFQVLVPHRPGRFSLSQKNADIRQRHRIPADVPLIFIEVELGDPSDFSQVPLMQIVVDGDIEVIRIRRCVSIAHTIAALALALGTVGRPPEIIFGWSHEMPLAANLNFLLLGQGNVPWMVQALIQRGEPDPLRQPRIVVG